MQPVSNTFSKEERLTGKTKIDALFTSGKSFVVYPYRIVYKVLDQPHDAKAAMFVSVPKKKFKRAVKRNVIRRRVKEAYRLNKANLLEHLDSKPYNVAIAFLYLDKEIKDYFLLEKKMIETLSVLKDKLE